MVRSKTMGDLLAAAILGAARAPSSPSAIRRYDERRAAHDASRTARIEGLACDIEIVAGLREGGRRAAVRRLERQLDGGPISLHDLTADPEHAAELAAGLRERA